MALEYEEALNGLSEKENRPIESVIFNYGFLYRKNNKYVFFVLYRFQFIKERGQVDLPRYSLTEHNS